MALTLVTNLSYTVLLIKSLPAILLSLLKSTGVVFSLSKSILSTSAFKPAKSDFAAKPDISTLAVPFKSAFVSKLDRSNYFIFPPERSKG